MTTILRGDARRLAEACRRHGGASALSFGLASSPRCWHGIRHLLAELRQRVGDPDVNAVLARHLPAAARVPGVLAPGTSLDPEQALASQRFAAWPESHLSHNLLVQAPLFNAWAALLADLFDTLAPGTPLLVPDLATLDRESLAALRALERRFPDSAPPLIAGTDPHRQASQPDADGLIWEDPVGDAHRVVFAFASRPGSEIVELSDSPEDLGSAEPAPALPGMEGDALDERAFARLLSKTPLDAQAVSIGIEALRISFESFGFTAALRLGLALLEHRPKLTPEQAAEVHGTVALAAHNRQFRSRGNHDLARFLEHHLRHALEVETLAARRSCLCYRLAVTLARRRKDVEAGIKLASQAIEEAHRDPSLPAWQAAHLEAWARNIRAYALMGARRLDEAERDCENAFDLADRALRERPTPAFYDADPRIRETAFTRSLLADNLAALAKIRGRGEDFERWKRIADEINLAAPGLARFEAILWIDLYRDRHLLEPAILKAREGRDAARSEQDPLREYNYSVQLADLLDRRGDAAAAQEVFVEAMELRRRLGSPSVLRPIAASAAHAAARAGNARGAVEILEAALDTRHPQDSRAPLLARLGWALARAGDSEPATARIHAAVDLAVEDGRRDVLLDVAVLAGRVAEELGRHGEAMTAYRQTLEMAGVEGETPPPAALLFAAELALARLDDQPDERLVRALRLVSEALGDAQSWWMLANFLDQLATVLTPRALHDPVLRDALHELRAAAGQRPDCGIPLAGLVAALESA